jgi:hypothetical protein
MRSTVLLLALATGCSVGEVNLNGGGGGDGGGGGGGDGGGSAAICVDRGQVGVAHVHAAGGGTNAGQDCMAAGCHNAGGPGGTFTAAGTVYKADKVTPNPGAAIRIMSGGQTYTAFADDAGTFRFTQAITYPATTDVSACPDAVPMLGQLRAGQGACSLAGCHIAGAQGQIYFQ